MQKAINLLIILALFTSCSTTKRDTSPSSKNELYESPSQNILILTDNSTFKQVEGLNNAAAMALERANIDDVGCIFLDSSENLEFHVNNSKIIAVILFSNKIENEFIKRIHLSTNNAPLITVSDQSPKQADTIWIKANDLESELHLTFKTLISSNTKKILFITNNKNAKMLINSILLKYKKNDIFVDVLTPAETMDLNEQQYDLTIYSLPINIMKNLKLNSLDYVMLTTFNVTIDDLFSNTPKYFVSRNITEFLKFDKEYYERFNMHPSFRDAICADILYTIATNCSTKDIEDLLGIANNDNIYLYKNDNQKVQKISY